MAADKLAIYNAALGHLGSRELAYLGENRDPRRRLDAAWINAVAYTLEQGKWSFATRSMQLAADPTAAPPSGFRLAYRKPADWLKTVEITSDERGRCPVVEYADEAGFWFTDVDPLYVRFVSLDPAYGLDMTRWSPSFTDYLEIRLAQLCCQRITGSNSMMADLVKLEKEARKRAKGNDALNTPPAIPPVGSWVMARRGRVGFGIGNGEGPSGPGNGLSTQVLVDEPDAINPVSGKF